MSARIDTSNLTLVLHMLKLQLNVKLRRIVMCKKIVALPNSCKLMFTKFIFCFWCKKAFLLKHEDRICGHKG